MINHNIDQNLFEQVFKDQSIKVRVVLKSSKAKATAYDKFRDVGYVQTHQNPLFVKALKKDISPNSLIIREIGLTESGAVQIIVHNNDVALIKLCDTILIKDIQYTPWNKALGSKFQVFELPFNYSKIILFRINNQ